IPPSPEDPVALEGLTMDDPKAGDGLACLRIDGGSAHPNLRVHGDEDLPGGGGDSTSPGEKVSFFSDVEGDFPIDGPVRPDELAIEIGLGFPVEVIAFLPA